MAVTDVDHEAEAAPRVRPASTRCVVTMEGDRHLFQVWVHSQGCPMASDAARYRVDIDRFDAGREGFVPQTEGLHAFNTWLALPDGVPPPALRRSTVVHGVLLQTPDSGSKDGGVVMTFIGAFMASFQLTVSDGALKRFMACPDTRFGPDAARGFVVLVTEHTVKVLTLGCQVPRALLADDGTAAAVLRAVTDVTSPAFAAALPIDSFTVIVVADPAPVERRPSRAAGAPRAGPEGDQRRGEGGGWGSSRGVGPGAQVVAVPRARTGSAPPYRRRRVGSVGDVGCSDSSSDFSDSEEEAGGAVSIAHPILSAGVQSP